MARRKPPTGYYTATIAKKKLGNISDGMLRSYVTSGKIKRVVPSERKQGFYAREDVDRLALSLDAFFAADGYQATQAMRATREDMPECVELLIEVFGGGDTTERRQSWIDKNPDVAWIVRSKGKITGCAFILPLPPEKIEEIFQDPNSASIASIKASDIQAYVPGQPAYLYFASIAARPGISETVNRTRGELIIRGIVRFLIELGNRGVPIALLAARSDTKDGIDLLRHLGFTELESATHFRIFIVEVERSGIPIILKYKAALTQWKETHAH